jgi:hypothetical protein
MPMSESATANVRCMCETGERALTLDDGAAVDGVGVAGHAAGDGDGRAARADGDVQAAEHYAEEWAEETLGGGVEAAGVLDVLAALRRTSPGAGAGAGGHGGHGADEGEGDDEGLGEHRAEEVVEASSAGGGCSSLRQHSTRDLMSYTR